MLRDKINDGMKNALKSQDKPRLSALRLVNAAIKNADIEARGAGRGPLSDDDLLGVMQKMIKQRQESVELYEKGGRKELADQERAEIAVISGFLPKQLSDEEMKAAITATIKDTGASSMKDMGKVIGALRGKYAGQMDFGKASALVKAVLSGQG
ncbi:MAG: GatB/YqeY domain-containing protein [Xanthobacteraceae bacterium]